MDKKIKIGRFAELCGVTVKTLRYYDRLELLKPQHVDEQSGYRYYTAEQLLTVKRIRMFKEQGFTLEQIKSFLEQDVSTDAVQRMLSAKRIRLESTIREAQHQLVEIGARMERLEQLEQLSLTDRTELLITVRSVPPILVASVRDVIPLSSFCLLLDEVMLYVHQHNEYCDQTPIVLWHSLDGNGYADIEVALPVSKEIPSGSRVKTSILSEIEAASHIYLSDPYQIDYPDPSPIVSWSKENGRRISNNAPVREVYLSADKDLYGTSRLVEMLVPLDA